jgi:hypothetical protein
VAGSGARGWGTVVGLSLVAAALSVAHPALLIFVPLALLVLALPPREPKHLVIGGVLLAVLLLGPTGEPLWYMERGWALLLGAWFVIMVVGLPDASFITRALAAVGVSAASAVLALLVRGRAGLEQADWVVAGQLQSSATEVASALSGGRGAGEGLLAQFADAVYRTAELQALLFPALLALASLSALAVAWWGYRRLTDREPQPLRPLREFRFHDEPVWLFIAGVMLLLLPLDAVFSRAGSNMLLFMSALYALRGFAVLLAIAGSPGPLLIMLGVAATIILYPLVMTATIVVGLTDTWLDLRARRQRARGRSL